MNRRVWMGTMVMAASLFAGGVASATPVKLVVPVAMLDTTKPVRFSLRNDTNAPVKLSVGANANQLTITPGETVEVKLFAGDKIIAAETSGHFQAGTVVTVAQPQLQDATVALK
jgi:hypothetical protein